MWLYIIKNLSREFREEVARKTKKERLGTLEQSKERFKSASLSLKAHENKRGEENINC